MGELNAIVGKNKVREEQLRRERALEAKRKRELIAKRKKMKKIRFVAAWSTVVMISLMVFVLLINAIIGMGDKEQKSTESVAQTTEAVEVAFDPTMYTFTDDMYKYEHSEAVLERYENAMDTNKDILDKMKFIYTNKEAYPENLLKLVAKCPETIDFAIDYPFKKGDDTLVVDLSSEYVEGELPYLVQWDSRWGYVEYGVETIALDGCGPTCLSMVAVGLTGNVRWTPIRISKMAMENGYYVDGMGTAWTLMYEGCETMGLKAKVIGLSEAEMAVEVNAGRPIIASMAPGDFTDAGHFIVIVRYEDGLFYVHDPNSKANTEKGWSYEKLKTQIKNMWSYTVK